MKRLFAAIKIYPEEALKDMVTTLRKELWESKIKWVNLDNIHLTLHFFGDIEEDRIPVIKALFSDIAQKHQKFIIHLERTGYFGKKHNPRVLWAGFRKSRELIDLQESMVKSLAEKGFKIDERPFSPHLTIGRVKYLENKDIFYDQVSEHKDTYFQSIDVKKIILFESKLHKTGPKYTNVADFQLAT